MKNIEEIIGTLLAIISILITLTIPIPLSQDFRLAIIGAILIFYITISIFRFNKRLEEQENEQKGLEEKLKIHEHLIEIKADIKNLQDKTNNLQDKVNKYETKRYK